MAASRHRAEGETTASPSRARSTGSRGGDDPCSPTSTVWSATDPAASKNQLQSIAGRCHVIFSPASCRVSLWSIHHTHAIPRWSLHVHWGRRTQTQTQVSGQTNKTTAFDAICRGLIFQASRRRRRNTRKYAWSPLRERAAQPGRMSAYPCYCT